MSSPTNADLHLMGLLLYKSNAYQLIANTEGLDISKVDCEEDLNLFARALSDVRAQQQREISDLKDQTEQLREDNELLKEEARSSVKFDSNNTEDIAMAAVKALTLDIQRLRDTVSGLITENEELSDH